MAVVIQSGYGLGPEFEESVLACSYLANGFLRKFRPVLSPDIFVSPLNAEFLLLLVEFYDKYKKVPGRDAFKDFIRQSGNKDAGALVRMSEDIQEPEDVAYVVDRLISWAKWRRIDSILGTEELRHDPRDFAKQIEVASRTGDDLLMEHTRLDEDRDDETVQGEQIPTPWEWLNTRLRGGPCKGDFVIVMTVINGGKTTILTNVAGHALAMGKHVVYFTFEDGEIKMKRRMLQWINGWTVDEIMNGLPEARRNRDYFLEQTGGSLHIKDLKSRRSTVDDAIAFVRSIEDLTGRKVDVVVTDYMDRFRAQGRYNEPRHALREVYEDGKFLARDLDVVHWSASQIAQKQGAGKDVVGFEMGSESTGKFESCDIALGFGQTLQDEKLGTITLNTSKMRDAQKHDITQLIAEFDIQRVYEKDNDLMRRERRRR